MAERGRYWPTGIIRRRRCAIGRRHERPRQYHRRPVPAVNQEWAGRCRTIHQHRPRCSRIGRPFVAARSARAPAPWSRGWENWSRIVRSRAFWPLAAAVVWRAPPAGREEAAESLVVRESQAGHWRAGGQRAVVLRRTRSTQRWCRRQVQWRADPDSLPGSPLLWPPGCRATTQGDRSISQRPCTLLRASELTRRARRGLSAHCWPPRMSNERKAAREAWGRKARPGSISAPGFTTGG